MTSSWLHAVKERLDALGQELKHNYGVVDTLVADLGNSADLKRVENALADDERITVLVNNAGTSAVKPSVDLPVSEVEHQMNVNAKAVTHLSLAVLPGFVKRHQYRFRAFVLRASNQYFL
jgi:uncharacterized protein